MVNEHARRSIPPSLSFSCFFCFFLPSRPSSPAWPACAKTTRAARTNSATSGPRSSSRGSTAPSPARGPSTSTVSESKRWKIRDEKANTRLIAYLCIFRDPIDHRDRRHRGHLLRRLQHSREQHRRQRRVQLLPERLDEDFRGVSLQKSGTNILETPKCQNVQSGPSP